MTSPCSKSKTTYKKLTVRIEDMIRKAMLQDAPEIKRLISMYPDDVLQVPLFHIYTHIREFFVAENKGIVGCVALRIFWNDLAEIRSLCVHPDYRRRGVGSLLVRAALDEARAFGIQKVFTLTRSPKFFEKLNFKIVDKQDLPIKVFHDCLHCPKYEENCDETAMLIRLKKNNGLKL